MSKKDACYHKVKARFKVFPSAYAGGAIAKCRKVGAANYGNKTKKKDGGLLDAIKNVKDKQAVIKASNGEACLLYTSPSPRDGLLSRMPSSA